MTSHDLYCQSNHEGSGGKAAKASEKETLMQYSYLREANGGWKSMDRNTCTFNYEFFEVWPILKQNFSVKLHINSRISIGASINE